MIFFFNVISVPLWTENKPTPKKCLSDRRPKLAGKQTEEEKTVTRAILTLMHTQKSHQTLPFPACRGNPWRDNSPSTLPARGTRRRRQR